jgi:hypothetical protein
MGEPNIENVLVIRELAFSISQNSRFPRLFYVQAQK